MPQSFVRDAETSLVENAKGDNAPAGRRPSRKALWGLYSVYLCIGVVYGFFAPNISGPLICHYKFGPFGKEGGTDAVKCGAGYALFGFSWQIKVFIALFVENFPIFKTRKRYWIVFGWGFALTILAVTGFMVPSFLKQEGATGYSSWVLMMTLMDCGVAFADVAADGLAVAYSKYEPDSERGTIISTNYQCRFFTTMVFAGAFKMLFMGGPDWVNPESDRPPTFGFDLDMQMIHFVLLAIALVPFAGICLWLEDPPEEEGGHHETGCTGIVKAVGTLWTATKSYAVWSIVVYAIGIFGIAGLMNPADQVVSDIADANSIQTGTGTILSYLFLIVGIQLFKNYFLNGNLRTISIWCYLMNSLLQLPELPLVYLGYKWPATLTGYFYQIQADLPALMQAIAFCLVQLIVVDIAPPGLEASVYEFLLTAVNISQSVASILQAILTRSMDLDSLGGGDYKAYHNESSPMYDLEKYNYYETRMATGIFVTVAVASLASVWFSFFLPRNAKECREWAAIPSWQVNSVAGVNFGILGFMIIFTLYGLVGNLASHIAFFQADWIQNWFMYILVSYITVCSIYKMTMKCGTPTK